jgi:hypothetical protein
MLRRLRRGNPTYARPGIFRKSWEKNQPLNNLDLTYCSFGVTIYNELRSYKGDNMTISYGPLTWATSFEELTDTSVNYFWQGSFPVGYDEMGIPVDENGLQCLPLECIFHPSCRPRVIEELIDAQGEMYTLIVPDLSCCQKWFDDNFLEITQKTLRKHATAWTLRNNSPMTLRNIIMRIRPNASWWSENLYRSQDAKNGQ